MKYGKSNDPYDWIDQWAFRIYNSEFCNETNINNMLNDMDYEEFVNLSNMVLKYEDIRQAAEKDQEIKSKREEQANNIRGKFGKA